MSTYYLLGAKASGSNFLDIQVDGSAPTAATSSTGWTVGTVVASRYSAMYATVERASSTVTTTVRPDAAVPDATNGDCWRTPTALSGSFANANWTFTFNLRAVTRSSNQSVAIRMAIYRGTAADGSDATIVGTVQQGSSTGALATNADGTSTITYNPGALSCANQYLFFKIAIITVVAGGNANCDALFRAPGSSITTSTYTALNIYSHTSTGGATAGGTALQKLIKKAASTGGATVAGAALAFMTWAVIGSGGATAGGAADASYEAAPVGPVLRTVTVGPGRDYANLQAALNAESKGLVALNRRLDIACYAMEDTTKVSFSGWTTDSTRYIRVYAVDRHDGTWDTTAYRLNVYADYVNVIDVAANYTVLEGLQIRRNGGSGSRALVCCNPAHHVTVEGCVLTADLVASPDPNYSSAFHIFAGASNLFVRNSVIFDVQWGAVPYNDVDPTFQNCTFQNCTHYAAETAQYSRYICTNCIFKTAPLTQGSSRVPVITYCASSDGTADDWGGDGNRVNQTFTFVDEAGDDFHLAAGDGGAQGYGTDLSAQFTTDIDGDTRDLPWDIGADQRSGAAPTEYPYASTGGATAGGAAFLVRTQTYLGSGGATGAGAAFLVRTQTYLGSGGATAGGSAGVKCDFTQAGSGGATAGGSALTGKVVVRPFTGSGGATAGGSASLKCNFNFTGSGGATAGGGVSTARIVVQPFTGSGGATAGGSAVVTVVRPYTGSGGATAGGAASASYVAAGLNEYTHTSTGGATAGGSAAWARVTTAGGSGGATAGGAAGVTVVHKFIGSGGATAGGSALASYEAAPVAGEFPYTGSGGATAGGSAGVATTHVVSGSGGATAGGENSQRTVKTVQGSGGAVAGGEANASQFRVYEYIGSGGATANGQAETKTVHATQGSGGAASGGSGFIVRTRVYLGSGGATAGGAAVVGYVPVVVGGVVSLPAEYEAITAFRAEHNFAVSLPAEFEDITGFKGEF